LTTFREKKTGIDDEKTDIGAQFLDFLMEDEDED
jgi:hypothetical protein